MKTFKYSIFLLFLLFPMAGIISARDSFFASVAVGDSGDAVQTTLSKPLQQTEEDGYTVWWYESIAPDFTNYLLLKDGNVVFLSEYRDDKSTLAASISLYGPPAVSVPRYPDNGKGDSLVQRVHIWPQKGKAVITSGESTDSRILREETFAPMTLDQYYESWGKAYKENTPVSIITPTPSVQNITNKPIEKSNNLRLYLIIIGVVGIALLLVVKIKAKR